MGKQIKNLTKVQLCNLFNLNVVKHSKDKRKKQGMFAVLAVWILLVAMLFFYVGAMTLGYIKIGLSDVVPMDLIMIASLLIFFFALFKAGSVIFQKKSYEMLCSLPVSQTAIVVSRFFSMYVGNVLLAVAVVLPGMTIYAYYLKPSISFYIIGIISILFLPLLPITVATLLGAIITAIASRMRHKNLITSALSILMVIGIMVGSSMMTNFEGSMTQEMLQDMVGLITTVIHRLYPPAVWAGSAMISGHFVDFLLYLGFSVLVFVAMVAIVSSKFYSICRGLYSTTAKHNYKMGSLKKSSILKTLWKKEWKRYLASPIYVTNTIVGPIMMLIFSGMILVMGMDKLQAYLPIPGGIEGLLPFALPAVCCLMTTTASSISLEGKEWWIVNSLPVATKTILDGKLFMNLSLIAPFYFISEVLVIVATKPDLLELLWLVLLPIIFIFFSCVFGITVNLRFAVFNWENEVTVVKQSTASMLGGVGGCMIIVACVLPMILVPQMSHNLWKIIIGIVMSGVTLLLYCKNNRVDLKTI